MDDARGSASPRDAEGVGLQRRLVTVLFCDLSGYTTLSETLDPEEVQALLGRVFGEAAQVIARYGGHIDKFVGDAVMALFGVPESHEDDPLRCVSAAREIHEVVSALGSPAPGLPPLAMHSGIETGVVVSGQVHNAHANETVLGDVVNVAARLVPVAARGEIVVGPEAHALTCGAFDYEDLGERRVRGRNDPLHLYRLTGLRASPTRVHGAGREMPALFGRDSEMASLLAAVDRATVGKSTLVLITGDAGTGKSRLVEELKAARQSAVAWYSGYCYEYARDFPFFPVIDLLSRAWGITDRDSPESVRARIRAAVSGRLRRGWEVSARLARLWDLDSAELRGLDPESWRAQLPLDIGSVIEALSDRGPTVFALEDLHWADSSSLELLASLLSQDVPGMVYVCTARSPFTFGDAGHFGEHIGHVELALGELPHDDAEQMIAAMLVTEDLPDGLAAPVLEHAGGNPFYLQEVVNSLVHDGVLECPDGRWQLRREFHQVEVPAGVREMLAARLEALSDEDRWVLHNAAVLGQAFSIPVVDAVVAGEVDTRGSIRRLASAGFLEPFGDERCQFRHALVQEAVYDGILRPTRRDMHERAAEAIEQVYSERLAEHYEMLALHFSRGHSDSRAVRYLVLSGEKCIGRYALDQAGTYFEEAYRLLGAETEAMPPQGDVRVVELVSRWAPVYWYRGDFLGLEALLSQYADLARCLEQPRERARYGLWFGTACWNRQKLRDCRAWLEDALTTGEEIGDQLALCLAHSWLAYALTDLGEIAEGVAHGLAAREHTRGLEDDHFVVSHAYGASAYTYWAAGEPAGAIRAGEELLSSVGPGAGARPKVFAAWAMALGHICAGDYDRAERVIEGALAISADPWTSQFPRMFAGLCCIYRDDFERARMHLEGVLDFADANGAATLGTPARGLLGAALIGLGEMNRGMALLDEARDEFEAGERPWGTAQAVFLRGSLHARIATRSVSVKPSAALRNVGFIVHHVPGADRAAQRELGEALSMCETMGARGMAGRCRMELGDLAAARSRDAEARRLWTDAARDFEACGASVLRSEALGRTA